MFTSPVHCVFLVAAISVPCRSNKFQIIQASKKQAKTACPNVPMYHLICCVGAVIDAIGNGAVSDALGNPAVGLTGLYQCTRTECCAHRGTEYQARVTRQHLAPPHQGTHV